MNQVFRITVGQDTLQGRLPPVRVGKGYCCRFHIYGVDYDADVTPPKIWVAIGTDVLFWTGAWNENIGAWVVDVNTDASAVAGTKSYALTVYDETTDDEFLVGQAAFVVFNTIITGEGASGGTAGQSIGERLDAIEDWMATFASLPMFDPESAQDFEMREQVQAITNKLRDVL